jgi:hypothetical protein
MLDPQLQQYLDRGWLIFPCSWHPGDKRPLIEGGFYSATSDPRLVAIWWARWPPALCAIRTGKRPQGSGIAIVDVDVRHHGFSTLARLVGPQIPQVPRVTTPSGGLHLYFSAPPNGCFSTVGPGGKRRRGLGEGVDVKCDLAMCHAPNASPACRYYWDPKFGLDLPLLPLPAVLTPIEVPDDQEEMTAARPQRPIARPDAYAEKSLSNACDRIRSAAPGEQRSKLNNEALGMGNLAAGMGLDHASVVHALIEAGMSMANQAGRAPWRRHEVRDVVMTAFRDGLRKPKTPQLHQRRRR